MEVIDILYKWKRDKRLKKEEFLAMAESYRRAHAFHNGDYTVRLLLIYVPYLAKESIKNGYIIPVGKETKRSLNWYSLTEKGVNMLQELEKLVGEWSEDKNMIFWNL